MAVPLSMTDARPTVPTQTELYRGRGVGQTSDTVWDDHRCIMGWTKRAVIETLLRFAQCTPRAAWSSFASYASELAPARVQVEGMGDARGSTERRGWVAHRSCRSPKALSCGEHRVNGFEVGAASPRSCGPRRGPLTKASGRVRNAMTHTLVHSVPQWCVSSQFCLSTIQYPMEHLSLHIYQDPGNQSDWSISEAGGLSRDWEGVPHNTKGCRSSRVL